MSGQPIFSDGFSRALAPSRWSLTREVAATVAAVFLHAALLLLLSHWAGGAAAPPTEAAPGPAARPPIGRSAQR